MRLTWRPQLRFFEQRTEILRGLEELDLLPAFRWSENSVAARLGRTEMLELSSRSADLDIAGPDGDTESARRALAYVLDVLKPGAIKIEYLLLQYLLPLDVSYEVAKAVTSKTLLGDVLTGSQPRDWAFLVDGASEKVQALYQVEFGVIDDEEAPQRVGRQIGRVQTARSAPDDVLEALPYPDCALFFDWRWSPAGALSAENPAEELFRVWDRLVQESTELSDAVKARSGIDALTQMEAQA